LQTKNIEKEKTAQKRIEFFLSGRARREEPPTGE
jgi:hypothetical protein